MISNTNTLKWIPSLTWRLKLVLNGKRNGATVIVPRSDVHSFNSRKSEDLEDFLVEYQKLCGSDYDLEFVCSDGSVQFYQVGQYLS